MEQTLFWLVPASSVLALVFAWYFHRQMMQESEGTTQMMKIAQALKLKHIPETTYRPLMAEVIDPEEYLSLLRSLLNAKRRSLHVENDYELKGKLIRYALGRGFEMDDIARCIDLSEEKE